MDRISGLMPQIGWSPGLAPVQPEKAPATTVEPLSNKAGTTGGQGADVDTQTSEDRSAQVFSLIRGLGTGAESSVSAEVTVLARSQDQSGEPDPEAIAGPPPTFEISPLEAKAAELAKPPEPGAATEASATTGTAATPATAASDVSTAPAETAASKAPTSAAENTAAEDRATTSITQSGWQALETAAQGQSLDLLR